MNWLHRILGDRSPAEFTGELAAGEEVLSSAVTSSGESLVVTALGLWVPADAGYRRIGWHLISKATWREPTLTVTEADRADPAGDAIVIADREPIHFSLRRAGKIPQMVRHRVDGSIRSRYRKELGGGVGAWFVQRKVPGQDGTVLQVRPDPGADTTIVAAIAREAAQRLASPEQ